MRLKINWGKSSAANGNEIFPIKDCHKNCTFIPLEKKSAKGLRFAE